MSVTTELGGRLAARGRAKRRTRLTITLTVTALLGLLGLAGWLLLGTSVLGVRDVEVTGTSRLDPAEIRQLAAIEPGTPLATLDTGSVADRVLRLPAVRTVDVQRSWPRGVTIEVTERTAAAVQLRGQAYVLVDRDGIAFAPVDRRPRGLPLVSAPSDAGPPALRAALGVLGQLSPSVRDQVRQVRATSRDRVEVALTRGRVVVWGSTERGERKAAVLAVLIDRKARVYDVSAPDTPTTKK